MGDFSKNTILQTKLKRKNFTAVELDAAAAALFKILCCVLKYFQRLKIGFFLFLIACSQTFCFLSRQRRAHVGSARKKIKKPRGRYIDHKKKKNVVISTNSAQILNKQRSCLNFSVVQKENATRINGLHSPPPHPPKPQKRALAYFCSF